MMNVADSFLLAVKNQDETGVGVHQLQDIAMTRNHHVSVNSVPQGIRKCRGERAVTGIGFRVGYGIGPRKGSGHTPKTEIYYVGSAQVSLAIEVNGAPEGKGRVSSDLTGARGRRGWRGKKCKSLDSIAETAFQQLDTACFLLILMSQYLGKDIDPDLSKHNGEQAS
jgi:hypothetical protein